MKEAAYKHDLDTINLMLKYGANEYNSTMSAAASKVTRI